MSRPKVITDMRQYQRDYHSRRRALTIANGVCISCNDDRAEKGKTKCAGCRMAAAVTRERKARTFNPRLTDEQRADIQRLASIGETQVNIAQIVGCHKKTVWAHLQAA